MTSHFRLAATRTIAGLALAGAMSLSALPASAAVTPSSVNGVQHFLDCLGVMIHNPAEHALFCSPGQTLPFESLSTPGGPAYEAPCRAYVMSDADPEPVLVMPGAPVHVADNCYTGPILDSAPAD